MTSMTDIMIREIEQIADDCGYGIVVERDMKHGLIVYVTRGLDHVLRVSCAADAGFYYLGCSGPAADAAGSSWEDEPGGVRDANTGVIRISGHYATPGAARRGLELLRRVLSAPVPGGASENEHDGRAAALAGLVPGIGGTAPGTRVRDVREISIRDAARFKTTDGGFHLVTLDDGQQFVMVADRVIQAPDTSPGDCGNG